MRAGRVGSKMAAQDGMSPDAAVLATVRGRVQGVNFRSFAASHARRLGLAGWVRNLPDGGAVEVYAEGPRAAVEALLRRLDEGPGMARVDAVETDWRVPSRDADGFAIRW